MDIMHSRDTGSTPVTATSKRTPYTRTYRNKKKYIGTGFSAITAGELKVILEVIKGQTDKRASIKLGVERCTIASHLTSIFAKLNVHNRTELAYEILTNGTITETGEYKRGKP